jgi:hypothetical protein
VLVPGRVYEYEYEVGELAYLSQAYFVKVSSEFIFIDDNIPRLILDFGNYYYKAPLSYGYKYISRVPHYI